ncbi:hypothetical protein AYI68_g3892 [Smittium mucronatum]|uniref:YMC020W-like alpha/beta hydrolase domain-containing protein n=1 Tax=Smittium mucronatum TaxID=133383 RepID=A0A1R0GYR8_9FUNG|nr:hypothetical protein AYI68_g3892 [Smittium mucronatum]
MFKYLGFSNDANPNETLGSPSNNGAEVSSSLSNSTENHSNLDTDIPPKASKIDELNPNTILNLKHTPNFPSHIKLIEDSSFSESIPRISHQKLLAAPSRPENLNPVFKKSDSDGNRGIEGLYSKQVLEGSFTENKNSKIVITQTDKTNSPVNTNLEVIIPVLPEIKNTNSTPDSSQNSISSIADSNSSIISTSVTNATLSTNQKSMIPYHNTQQNIDPWSSFKFWSWSLGVKQESGVSNSLSNKDSDIASKVPSSSNPLENTPLILNNDYSYDDYVSSSSSLKHKIPNTLNSSIDKEINSSSNTQEDSELSFNADSSTSQKILEPTQKASNNPLVSIDRNINLSNDGNVSIVNTTSIIVHQTQIEYTSNKKAKNSTGWFWSSSRKDSSSEDNQNGISTAIGSDPKVEDSLNSKPGDLNKSEELIKQSDDFYTQSDSLTPSPHLESKSPDQVSITDGKVKNNPQDVEDPLQVKDSRGWGFFFYRSNTFPQNSKLNEGADIIRDSIDCSNDKVMDIPQKPDSLQHGETSKILSLPGTPNSNKSDDKSKNIDNNEPVICTVKKMSIVEPKLLFTHNPDNRGGVFSRVKDVYDSSIIKNAVESMRSAFVYPFEGRFSGLNETLSSLSGNHNEETPLLPHIAESPEEKAIHKAAKSLRKVVIIGIHGWFPNKLIQMVSGEPTGRSEKFCGKMKDSMLQYLYEEHGIQFNESDISIMPLAAQGKILDRVEKLLDQLIHFEVEEEIVNDVVVPEAKKKSKHQEKVVLIEKTRATNNSKKKDTSIYSDNGDVKSRSDSLSQTSGNSKPNILPIDLTIPNKKDRVKLIREADTVLVVTHSQGTPVSVILLEKLIGLGIINPRKQRVGMLAMAGISHGPFPGLKDNVVIKYLEHDAARELFFFNDPSNQLVMEYMAALGTILQRGSSMYF